jgi:hypothetical protein
MSTSPPSNRRRRVLLRAGGLAAVGVAGGAAYVASHRDHPLAAPQFADMATARRTIEQLRNAPMKTSTGWDLPRVLHHAAQSIHGSIDGYPQLKPAWFRASAGSAAFAVFSARGRMSHGLDEPVPGMPSLADGLALGPAIGQALDALDRFERHTGPLAPHFAYGNLSKADYARAHLMHLANHWDLVVPA